MPLSDEQVVQGLGIMRTFHDEPSEELQRAVLDAAIARFGVCDCGVQIEAQMRAGPLALGPARLKPIGAIEGAKFCLNCGRRLGVPDADA